MTLLTILFGDGGTAKSYLALYLAGILAARGMPVALFDWEMGQDDHRLRLEFLFGADNMPDLQYVRCERALIHETDRLRRIVREKHIKYAIFDSVAYACLGAPEAADVAGYYFRAVRQIGVGSLHIAHITKGENGDQKPFGSVFWHNSARMTWNIKASELEPGVLELALFNRKANLSKFERPVGYRVTFGESSTLFKLSNVADSPDLAQHMHLRERMQALLKHKPMSIADIAAETEAKPDSISRTARRYRAIFTTTPNRELALLEKAYS